MLYILFFEVVMETNFLLDSMAGREVNPLFIGRKKCDSGHCVGPFVREYYLLHFCLSGEGVLHDSRGEHRVSAGQFFVIRPNEATTHTADQKKPWDYAWIAFDGDGDRCLAVSETGEVITGDHILYLFAKHFKKEGSLPHHTVVATIMSNMGLDIALKKEGIATVKTPVGDKFVGECMAKEGYALGGEQSGHIILSKYAKTGDGILTAVKLADCMLQKEQPISELYKGFFMYPQCLYSIRVKDKAAAMTDPDLLLAKEEAEQVLGEQGRLVLRPSGTEPVIRIMTEAQTLPLAQTAANLIRTALLPHSIVGTCRSVND